LIAAAILALVSVGVWFLGTLLALKGRDLWILRGGLWLLFTISAVAVAWFLSRRGPPPAKSEAQGGAEVDAAMAAARARLRSSPPGRRALQRLPVVLLLGSSSIRPAPSCGQPQTELLTGDVFRGELVAPTGS
jgi:hypothetical protein